jgi:deazaflavin-dependent oxidoreductase (nitroreductase family)
MYQRPGTLAKVSNGILGRLAALGLSPKKTVRLEVRGRKSGKMHSVPVNIVTVGGTEYLVAPRGNTHWSLNARAAGEVSIARGNDKRTVRVEEIPIDQRAPIIQSYLKENAMVTKAHFGIEPSAPIEEFHRIAADHPVFRVSS